MKVLVDTNVIINFLEDSAQNEHVLNDDSIIMLHAVRKEFDAYVSASAFTDIAYILTVSLRKANQAKPSAERRSNREIQMQVDNMMLTLLRRINVLAVTEKEIQDAYSSDWRDKEDAVQYFTALTNGIEAIITWNKRDYKASEIPVYTPTEFVTQLTK